MQRFAIIGLGRFGGRLAVNLASAGQEVIAVDNDAHLIEEFRDSVTLAIALDATDEQALLMHGLDKVDVAVVGIGDNFESNILATVLLKQLGVPRVISRAMSPMAARILSRIGADEVVNPEDEAADRWCTRLISPGFLSHFPVGDGYSVVEIQAPRSWLGKTLVELNLRAKLGVLIVAVKHREQQQGAVRQVVEFPNPNQPLQAQQSLVVMGPDESLAKLSGEDR
jgi:trk system potassium uptake protein TrkA